MKIKMTEIFWKNLRQWLKLFLFSVVFPCMAVILSIKHISNLQTDIRLQNFQTEAAMQLDKLGRAGNSEEYLCRNFSRIFLEDKNLKKIKTSFEQFSQKLNLELELLIWNSKGDIWHNNISGSIEKVNWKKAFNDLYDISKNKKDFLTADEEENFKRIFGPHFFPKFYHHSYVDVKPRLIRADSAEKRPLAWVKIARHGGILVFIKPEKLEKAHIFKHFVLKPDFKTVYDQAILSDSLISDSKKFEQISVQNLKALKTSYESLHQFKNLFVYKTRFARDVVGIICVERSAIEGLAFNSTMKFLLATFVLAILTIFIFITSICFFKIKPAINIRKQLTALFFVSNLFPLLILGVIGYDYICQYEAFLKIEAFSQGSTYLQNIDEMYISELSQQLRKLNKTFRWASERLKREGPTSSLAADFISEQDFAPFRMVFVGSHTQLTACEFGLLKNTKVIEPLPEEITQSQTGDIKKAEVMIIDYLDKLGKFYLAKLNNEVIDDKTMLKIELVAESLGQIKPLEMLQEFYASSGQFWQWGMGKQYFPAHTRLLKLFDSNIHDYVFLYLFKSRLLEFNYISRIYHRINRNSLGMRIMAFNKKSMVSIPYRDEINETIKEYVIGMTSKTGAEIEHAQIDGNEQMLIGLECNYLNNVKLLGIIPVNQIARKARKKYTSFMASGILSLLVALSLGLLVSRSFLSTLSELNKGVEALKKRDFNYRLPDLGRDEFGQLAQMFNSTLVDLEELQVASIVQEKLLPDLQDEFETESLKYAVATVPVFKLGGDFIDRIEIDNHTTALAFGDVAGQGIANSLVMAFVKSCLLQLGHLFDSPVAMVAKLNQLIKETNNQKIKKFMTFQYILLNRNQISIANAGHCFPVLIDKNTRQISYIELPSFPLGKAKKGKVSECTIKLKPGQSLIFYSGGVYRNPGLTPEYFENLLRNYCQLEPFDLCQSVIEGIFAKAPKSSCRDDLSLICIQNKMLFDNRT
jgi:hypothetical protein